MEYATLSTKATEVLGLTTFEVLKNLPPGERQERYAKVKEVRKALLAECRTRIDQAQKENRDFSPTETAEYDKLMEKIGEIDKQGAEVEKRWSAMLDPIKPTPGGFFGSEHRTTGERWLDPNTGKEYRSLKSTESLRMSRREMGGYDDGFADLDFGKYLRGLVSGNWKGAEGERRAVMVGGQGSLGGFLIPMVLSDTVIDFARNRAVCLQAGATTLPLDKPELTIARIDQDPTAYWRQENTEITESGLLFGAYNIKVKVLAGLVKLSVELLEDAPNVSDLITTSLSSALAVELDRAILRGQGAAAEPTGIRNSGINVISMGANGGPLSAYDNFMDGRKKIYEANYPGQDSGLSVILSPRDSGVISKMKDGQSNPLTAPDEWKAMRKFITNQIPTNLTKGTGSNLSEAYVGAFDQVLVAMMTPIRIEVSRDASDSTSSAFGSMQVFIRAYLRADVLCQRPTWFSVLDAIT